MFGFLKKKINLKGTLCFIPFLKTGAIEYFSHLLSVLIDVWMICVFLYLLKMWIFKYRKSDRFLLLLFVFFIATGVSTYLNDGVWYQYFAYLLKITTVFLYVKLLFINEKIDFDCMLLPIKLLFLLNIISFIVYPNGMYTMIGTNGNFYSNEVWIMGGKNSYFFYITFSIVISMLKYYFIKPTISYGIKRDFWLYILCFVNIFLCSKSSTTIVGFILLMLYIILEEKKVFKSRNIIFVYVVFLVLFVYVCVFDNNRYFMSFISSNTGKDITFTGRVFIWEKTIQAICNKPWMGYGFEDVGKTIDLIGQTTAHNKYLWVLYRGGIVGLFLFILILYISIKQLYKKYECSVSRNLVGVMFVVLITWCIEVYDNNTFIFAIIVICFYIQEIIVSRSKNCY